MASRSSRRRPRRPTRTHSLSGGCQPCGTTTMSGRTEALRFGRRGVSTSGWRLAGSGRRQGWAPGSPRRLGSRVLPGRGMTFEFLNPTVDPQRRNLTVELRCGDEPMTLISAGGRVHLAHGRATAPDVTIAGPPDAAVGLLLGRIGRAEAESRGVTATGDLRKLGRLRPRGERPAAAPAS